MSVAQSLWFILRNFPIYPTLGILTYVVINGVYKSVKGAYSGPLAAFRGPDIAAMTGWYKTYIEVFKRESWTTHLRMLHKIYGPVVRVGPNELHFDRPEAYFDIYNNGNRWEKEPTLYHSFGVNRSSFGFLKYDLAKQRKDVLLPMFSRRAITNLQSLVQSNVDRLCEVLKSHNATGKSSDLFLGLRCFTMDTILQYCLNQSIDALGAPDFRAPLVESMEASLSAPVVFKHFPLLREIVYSLPPWLSMLLSPGAAGIINMRSILGRQVKEVVGNPASLNDSPHEIIYHRLLDKEVNNGTIPSAESLYEEAQALMFAGGDTTSNALMVGTFHILANKSIKERLVKELKVGWPDLTKTPTFEDLERLPYLTAIITESLRISPGVVSPLLRITPFGGATIGGVKVPSRVIVGMSGIFVHESEVLFHDAKTFNPDRWLADDSPVIERWLVPFSKGPRMCIGQNLAYCEMFLGFAALFRRFDMTLDGSKLEDLRWRECHLPQFLGKHLTCFCKPVEK